MVESKLKVGTTLILDRCSYSGVAFSSAKGVDFEWCKVMTCFYKSSFCYLMGSSFEGPRIWDLVLYLDITPEKASERGGYGGERYEHLEFQKKVAQCYQILCDSSWKIKTPWTLLKPVNCILLLQTIDACQAIEDVEKELQDIVLDHVLTCREGKPLSLLWSR
ncbi:hypothetical protein Pint_25762 [Pistacia integerrima]|uniref:Uncharacterized protein n=1 Tax=Pistacia integerrima TaxID=434235 RepID=A0ACC0YHP6_9ROSI|nr:hypothetical protein Pint_25762 [Pistacia integerrima]